MNSPRKSTRRSGFTLLELVGAIALFSMGISVLTLALGTLLRMRTQEDRHDDQMVQLHETARQFRADIRAAIRFPKEGAGLKASDTLLLIETSGGVTLAWKSDGEGVSRASLVQGSPPAWTSLLGALRQPAANFRIESGLARLEILDRSRDKALHRTRLVVEAHPALLDEVKP